MADKCRTEIEKFRDSCGREITEKMSRHDSSLQKCIYERKLKLAQVDEQRCMKENSLRQKWIEKRNEYRQKNHQFRLAQVANFKKRLELYKLAHYGEDSPLNLVIKFKSRYNFALDLEAYLSFKAKGKIQVIKCWIVYKNFLRMSSFGYGQMSLIYCNYSSEIKKLEQVYHDEIEKLKCERKNEVDTMWKQYRMMYHGKTIVHESLVVAN